ncbi:MAG TPA: sulfatase [Bryobacteraceae bacterium]|nr:sulfatase [Bryobacteraceae bacterium]
MIVIFADDLGYADIGCFGSSIPTPNLDHMAEEGLRLTRFYSASPVCSPSRAALLTGRYPARTGIVSVLMPTDPNGLNPVERTIPKMLKERGYRTGLVGKWHLGAQARTSPCENGFDEFYGLPYSNDMYPLPVLRNTDVVEEHASQPQLTEKFTRRAVEFIERHADAPFFLYFAHTAPHIPLVPSARFKGKSGKGSYGDVVMELDWSVGQVLAALQAKGIDNNTLVIFTSDNGPWYQGSAGRLQGRKGSTYEGGVREPFIARFPGAIPGGRSVDALTSTMDLMPTIARLAGVSAGIVDGVDMWPILSGENEYPGREPLLFFDRWNIQCVRWGPWKLHLSRYNSHAWTPDPPEGRRNLPLRSPELYNVDEDPTESYDRSADNQQIVSMLRAKVIEMLPGFPDEVRHAWRETMSQRVQETPIGALPLLDGR